MQKEEQILIRHLADLSKTAGMRQNHVYSEFLSLAQQSLFHQYKRDITNLHYRLDGGHEDSERCCIDFYPEYAGESESPIRCLKIAPVNVRFSDKLTHRDYLGAILNLGIDRNQTGDIVIDGQNAYLYCLSNITDFIISNLVTIKHTKICCSLCNGEDKLIKLNLKTKQGPVSSMRIDAVIALAFSLSRTKAAAYILNGSVYANGRLIESNSYIVKDSDVISVRKLGKFKLEETDYKSKKDKFIVKTHIYN